MVVLRSLLGQYEGLARIQQVGTPDSHLLARFREGDDSAFETIVRRHGPRLFQVCRRELDREQDAEDVFQATFLVLARRAHSSNWQDSVAGWLFETARRLSREVKRKDNRRSRREQRARVDASPSAEDVALRRELDTVLHDELENLPERYRSAVLLCLFDGLSRDEAAQQVGCSLRTIKYRLERGRELLRSRLGKRGWALSTALTLSGLASPAAWALPESTTSATVAVATGSVLANSSNALLLADSMKFGVSLGATLAGVVLALVGVTLFASGFFFPPPPNGNASAEEPKLPQKAKQPPEQDHEPPLPAGALNRFGTLRFRHGNGMQTLRLSPDGKMLATFGGSDMHTTVQLMDSTTGRLLHTIPVPGKGQSFVAGARHIAFSPDGITVAVACTDGSARFFDTRTGKKTSQIATGANECNGVVFSTDGSLVVTSDEGIGHSVKAWDRKSNKLLWTRDGAGHCLRFSPDGKSVLAADTTGNQFEALVLLDAKTGKQQRRFQTKVRFERAAISSDGATLAAGGKNNHVTFWNLKTGEHLPPLKLPELPNKRSRTSVAFSPDGKTLVLGTSASTIELWSLTTRKLIRTLEGHSWWVTGLAFSPDGKTLYSGSWDSTIRRWHMPTGKEIPAPAGFAHHAVIAHSRTANRLAVGNGQGKPEVRLLDGQGKLLHRLAPLTSVVQRIAFSDDGRHLATGHRDGSVHLWTPKGKYLRQLEKPRANAKRADVSALEFSPDSSRIAVAVRGGHGATILTLDGKKQRTFEHRSCSCLAWSPDGARLLTGGWDNHLRAWSTTTGRKLLEFDTGDIVDDIEYSPVADVFATSHHHQPIRLWQAKTGKLILKLAGHEEAVFSIEFTPDGLWLLSGGVDRTLRLWDTTSGALVQRYDGHVGWVIDIRTNADGTRALTGSLDTTAILWSLRPKTEPIPEGSEADLEKALRSRNGTDFHKAYWQLLNEPKVSVPLLATHLRPTKRVLTKKRVTALIEQLDSDDFDKREQASQLLTRHAKSIEPWLQSALGKATSAETRNRLDKILATLDGESDEDIFHRRAFAILEKTPTKSAKTFLEKLASGPSEAPLTRRAKRALKRWASLRSEG